MPAAKPIPLPGQLPLDLGHVASHDEADFVVHDGNRLAMAHVRAFPDWPAPLSLVVGPAKAGKSHLGRIWAARAGAVAAAPGDVEALAQAGGRVPVLIEDIDRAGYDETAIFHLLNQAMRDRRPLLMTAREPVANWPFRTNDVLSRARLAAMFTVSADDDMLLSQMFVKLFGDRQVAVDPRIIGYVVARMERSPEEVVALVDVMDKLALAGGKPVSRAIAAQALALRGAGAEAEGEADWEGEDDE